MEAKGLGPTAIFDRLRSEAPDFQGSLGAVKRMVVRIHRRRAQGLDLSTCTFVERRENVLLLGQTGVGKSHIAQALGHLACRAGYTVLYTSAQDVLKNSCTQVAGIAPTTKSSRDWPRSIC